MAAVAECRAQRHVIADRAWVVAEDFVRHRGEDDSCDDYSVGDFVRQDFLLAAVGAVEGSRFFPTALLRGRVGLQITSSDAR